MLGVIPQEHAPAKAAHADAGKELDEEPKELDADASAHRKSGRNDAWAQSLKRRPGHEVTLNEIHA